MSWQPGIHVDSGGKNLTITSRIASNARTDNGHYLLGEILEEGTGRMAPRPHQEAIQKKAMPAIMKIYNEPYV